jgi:ABC-type sugar transport system permease subunit
VLTIAVLLRFMDSFNIYTEPFVLTGGGPGNATTLLSIDLVKIALGQFDLGPAAAMSLIYFLIILLLSWVFYRHDPRGGFLMRGRKSHPTQMAGADPLHPLPDVADLLAPEHVVQDHQRDPRGFSLYPQSFTLENYRTIFTDPTWYSGYINSLIYVCLNTSSRSPSRCRRPMPFRATAFSATSTCSSGC